MRTLHSFRKFCALLLAIALLSLQLTPAQAGMIGTGQALAAGQERVDRDALAALLEREDLQRRLASLGVDLDDARTRVAGMTDAEVARINRHVETAPAGGDVLGVLVLIFIVFIITDAIGATDIFPFVHPVR